MAAKEISVKKYVVRLSGEEREQLLDDLDAGPSPSQGGAAEKTAVAKEGERDPERLCAFALKRISK